MIRLPHLATLFLVCCSNALLAAGDLWQTDFAAASARAADEKKSLLIDFTGSDWCAWCIRLRKEVFNQDAFRREAPEHFVLVELDYPKDKSGQSPALQEQNRALLETYPVAAYPTVLLCDASGKPYAATGYLPGGPETYLARLDQLRRRQTARDQAFTEAAAMTGVAKARRLVAALAALELPPAIVNASYPGVIADIIAADPDDETGFASAAADERRLRDFLQTLGGFRSQGDIEGALAFIDKMLAGHPEKTAFRQQLHGHKAGTLATAGRKTEAITVLEAAVAEDPSGARTAELADFIEILRKEIDREKSATEK